MSDSHLHYGSFASGFCHGRRYQQQQARKISRPFQLYAATIMHIQKKTVSPRTGRRDVALQRLYITPWRDDTVFFCTLFYCNKFPGKLPFNITSGTSEVIHHVLHGVPSLPEPLNPHVRIKVFSRLIRGS